MACRVVVFLVVLSLISCKGGHKEQKINQSETDEVQDSTLIFDGKSLQGWEVTNFGPQGPVYVSGGVIILGMGDGCTGVTFKRDVPVINYEVSLDARRVEGNDFFCGLTFPVGKDPCTLIVGGWGSTTIGLSCINGMDASENETTSQRNFEKNRWYSIRLAVTGNNIEAWIDNEKVVDLTTTGKKLSIRAEVELSKPLGIASWNTTAGIRNIRIRRLEDSAN
jgi:hypothetical protein